jgi:hypothetical protein
LYDCEEEETIMSIARFEKADWTHSNVCNSLFLLVSRPVAADESYSSKDVTSKTFVTSFFYIPFIIVFPLFVPSLFFRQGEEAVYLSRCFD